nr:PEGA domain-containing protein [Desulfobacterales bacterium]
MGIFTKLLKGLKEVFLGKKVRVTITSDPKTSTIIVDDKETTKGEASLKLVPGTHKIRIEAPGYHSIKNHFVVLSKPEQKFHFTLAKIVSHIKTYPGEARVFIDDKDVGLSNLSIDLLPGSHKIRIEKDGHLPVKTYIVVRHSREEFFSFNLKKILTSIKVDPPDADIFIDDRHRGNGKVTLHLEPGSHKINISAYGYDPLRNYIVVRKNMPESFKFQLPKKQTIIRVKPDNAKIFINDSFKGTGKCVVDLPPGSHKIRIEAEKHQPKKDFIVIRKNRREYFDFRLAEIA